MSSIHTPVLISFILTFPQQKCQKFSLSTVVENNSKKHRLNVGVIGAGRIASSVHIPNVLRDRRYNISWIIEDSNQQTVKVQEDLFLQDIPFFKSMDRKRLLADKGLLHVLHC